MRNWAAGGCGSSSPSGRDDAQLVVDKLFSAGGKQRKEKRVVSGRLFSLLAQIFGIDASPKTI